MPLPPAGRDTPMLEAMHHHLDAAEPELLALFPG
jgi:hypothetical protein